MTSSSGSGKRTDPAAPGLRPGDAPPEAAERPRGDITRLLVRWSEGDGEALDALMSAVYAELRQLASSYLRRESSGHTLQTSALIHEAFLKLIDQREVQWQNRAHFFGIAAQAMRRILVDHARGQRYAKRGGGRRRLSLEEVCELPVERPPELVALDDALSDLAAIDPEQAKIVEMRYFAGLTGEEIAALLGQSVRTVTRRWRMARAWLYLELTDGR